MYAAQQAEAQDRVDKTVEILQLSVVEPEVVDQMSLVSMWLSVSRLCERPDWLLLRAARYTKLLHMHVNATQGILLAFCFECSTIGGTTRLFGDKLNQ